MEPGRVFSMGAEAMGMDFMGARQNVSPPVANALNLFLAGHMSAGAFSAALQERAPMASRGTRGMRRRRRLQ